MEAKDKLIELGWHVEPVRMTNDGCIVEAFVMYDKNRRNISITIAICQYPGHPIAYVEDGTFTDSLNYLSEAEWMLFNQYADWISSGHPLIATT